ncbi:MAG: hypothetical protein ACP5OG_00580 [Candidatus Nanoarchaeia archaeon]
MSEYLEQKAESSLDNLDKDNSQENIFKETPNSNIIKESKVPLEYRGLFVSPQRANEILAYASALRDINNRKEEFSKIPFNQDESAIPVQGIYKLAKDLFELEPEQINKALDIFYPSSATKIKDFKKVGAEPTQGSLAQIYEFRFKEILNKELPCSGLFVYNKDSSSPFLGLNYIGLASKTKIQKTEKVGFFRKKIVKYESVTDKIFGEVTIHYPMWVNVECKDPLFARLFGDTLEDIKKNFIGKCDYRINISYNPFKE